MAKRRQLRKKKRRQKKSQFDADLARLEKMPPGPARDALFAKLDKQLSDSDPEKKKKKRKKKRDSKALRDDEGFLREIQAKGLDKDFSQDTLDALDRYVKGEPLQPKTVTDIGDLGRVEVVTDRLKEIIELKRGYGIPLTDDEQTFGDAPQAPDSPALPPSTHAPDKVTTDPEEGQRLSDMASPGEYAPIEAGSNETPLASIGSASGVDPLGDKILSDFKGIPARMAAPLVGTASLAVGAAEQLGKTIIGEGGDEFARDKEEIKKRHQKRIDEGSFLQNAGEDLFDVVEGAAGLLDIAAGDPLSEEPPDLGVLASRNREVGRRMISGALGDMGAIWDDPVSAFRASPILTAASLHPVTRVAKLGLTKAGLSPQQIARLTGLQKIHDEVVTPTLKRLQEISGVRPEVGKIFDFIMTEATKKGNQLESISIRADKVLNDPAKLERVIRDLKEALPRDEAIEAQAKHMSERMFGEDLTSARMAPDETPFQPEMKLEDAQQGPNPPNPDQFDFFEELTYKTGIDQVRLPDGKWSTVKSTNEFIELLENPFRMVDAIAEGQRMARQERAVQIKKRWQLSKPMLQKVAAETKNPWASVPLSETAKKYLGETEDVVVPRGFNAHVTYRAWSEDPQMWGFWHKMQQMAKSNLTSKNPSSGLGNYMSNLLMQMVYQGASPLGIIKQGMLLNSQYHKWSHGELTDPKLSEFFKKAEERGLLDSTALIEAELGSGQLLFGENPAAATKISGIAGAVTGAAIGSSVGNPIGGAAAGAVGGPLLQQIIARTPLKKAIQASEDFYRFGDNMFKLQQAFKRFDELTGDVSVLRPGEHLKVANSKKGDVVIRREPGDKWSIDDVEVEAAQVKETLYDAGIQSAFDRFFDYRDSPLAVDWLRANRAFGLVSPFLMWQYRALDIPVFKKGLISRTLELPDPSNTNNPMLQAKALGRMVKVSMARSFMINGIRHQQSENRSLLRRALSFSPAAPRAMLLRATTNPLWIEADDIEQYNWQGPSMALLRWVDGLINNAPSPEELGEYLLTLASFDDLAGQGIIPPELADKVAAQIKQQIKLAKNQATMGDLLKLSGLGASIWADLYGQFESEASKGRAMNPARVYNAFTMAMVGGGVSKAFKLFLGMADVDSDPYLMSGFSERLSQPAEIRESLIRFSVRAFLGLGYRPMFMGTKAQGKASELYPNNYITRGLSRQQRILSSAMFLNLEEKARNLRRLVAELPENQAASALDEAERLEGIVKSGKSLVEEVVKDFADSVQSVYEDFHEVMSRE